MIANYQLISDRDLKKLMTEKDIADFTEELQEAEDCILFDMDKMWDVLHFVLTGVSAGEPIEGNPLSEAIVGVNSFEECEDFIGYTKKENIPLIVKKLNETDIDSLLENFSMQKCKENKLYPNIWGYEDEKEEIIEVESTLNQIIHNINNESEEEDIDIIKNKVINFIGNNQTFSYQSKNI